MRAFINFADLWPPISGFCPVWASLVLGVFTSAAPTDKNFIPPRGEAAVRRVGLATVLGLSASRLEALAVAGGCQV